MNNDIEKIERKAIAKEIGKIIVKDQRTNGLTNRLDNERVPKR